MFHCMFYFKDQSYVHQVSSLASASCFNFLIALLVKMTIQMLKNTETFLVYLRKFFVKFQVFQQKNFFSLLLKKSNLYYT